MQQISSTNITNQLNPITSTGSTLLHLTVNQNTPVDDFHTNEVLKISQRAKLQRQLMQMQMQLQLMHHGNKCNGN